MRGPRGGVLCCFFLTRMEYGHGAQVRRWVQLRAPRLAPWTWCGWGVAWVRRTPGNNYCVLLRASRAYRMRSESPRPALRIACLNSGPPVAAAASLVAGCWLCREPRVLHRAEDEAAKKRNELREEANRKRRASYQASEPDNIALAMTLPVPLMTVEIQPIGNRVPSGAGQ
jgi:hypothetical protein